MNILIMKRMVSESGTNNEAKKRRQGQTRAKQANSSWEGKNGEVSERPPALNKAGPDLHSIAI